MAYNFAMVHKEGRISDDDGGERDPVGAYIEGFQGETRRRLEEVRALIRAAAPAAEERIAYRMPAYYLNGPLVYFAGYAKHIGFYPIPSGIEAFEAELSAYPRSKGAVRFPLDRPLPADLITRIVKFRLGENQA